MLRREKLITTWHSRQVGAGEDLSKALDTHLNSASVILLLVSADFLASNYCYGVEVKRAMERHHSAQSARVIPILLRPVENWQRAPFGTLQPLPSNGVPITRWSNQDDAFSEVARGIRAALEDLQRLAVNTPSASFPLIWEVPYPRNQFFTGREEILQRLADTLKPGQPAALSQPQAISGLGGIGKTQLALEYAYHYRASYSTVFWTLADTRESLIASYVTIARRLNLPQQDAQDQMLTVQSTLHWLSTNTNWLLILDNADDLTLLREFLPTAFTGHLLLTTRAQFTGRLATRIEVNTMSQDTGILFLLRRAALLPLPEASLDQAQPENITTARQIYIELGGLPLALDQAGSYIEETQSGLPRYLDLYRVRRTDLLNYHNDLVNDHPEPVATTWSLAFEKVEQRSAAAADLLRLCAFLQPDAIPEEIITQGTADLDSSLSSFADDPLLLDKAIAVLGAYSLISRDNKDNTLSIHRLVQAVLKDSMSEAKRKEWSLRVVKILDAVFPAVEFRTWQLCERYLPHALACADIVQQEDIMSLDAASLLNKVAWYLDDRARYNEAELLYKKSLMIREEQLGGEHPDTATSVNNLAELYRAQGRYEEAEPLYERALKIREQQLGGEHPDTAGSLNNLAALYHELGRIKEAELLFRRALAIRERALGSEHPDTANSLSWLAFSHQQQQQPDQAQPLYERALAIYERVLGPDHPDTLNLRGHYASLLQDMAREVDEEE